PEIPPDLKEALVDVLGKLGNQRPSSIDTVRDMQLAVRPLFQLEAERLAAKFGANDPRTVAMRARADNRFDVAVALGIEAQIARIDIPATKSDDSLIHGRLTDPDLRAVAGVK